MKYICDHAGKHPDCKSCVASTPHKHGTNLRLAFYCTDVDAEVVCGPVPVRPARKPRRAGK